MKFTCEKQALLSAVTNVSGAVAIKNGIPALEGIFVNADTDGVTLTGYNLELGITSHIDAEVSEGGQIVLGSKLFGDIIRKLPDDIVTVTADESLLVNITGGISDFKIIGLSADDYPDLPDIDGNDNFTMKQNVLSSVISQTVFSVSDSETRPVHTGCKFSVNGSSLTVAAVDSFRLAVRNETVLSSGSFDFVAPGGSLKEAAKIMADSEDDVKVTLGRSLIRFEMGDNSLITRRLEGQFLDYERVIPQDASIKVVIDRSSFASCVERAALIISEKYRSPIRCTFGHNKATMVAATALGSSKDEVFISGDGKDMTIGFNSRYMLEALKTAPSGELLLEMKDSGSPIVIKPAEVDDNSFLFLVMPIRLSN